MAVLLVGLVGPGGAEAASQVVLQKGDGEDQILTVTADGGSTETSITFICEAPKREYGVVIQAPALAARGLRLKADGASVTVGSPFAAEGSVTFMLKDGSGQKAMARLTAARAVVAEFGGGRTKFALSDSAAEVARFRQNCGL